MSKKEHVALTRCFFCGDPDRILLATRYDWKGEPLKDLSQANNKVIDMEPCQKCADHMGQGVILLTVDSTKSESGWEKQRLPNPYRTGPFFVIKDDAIIRMMPTELATWAIKHRWMFIEHQAAEKLGLTL